RKSVAIAHAGREAIVLTLIRDLSGRVLARIPYDGDPISVAGLPQGIYLLEIVTEAGTYFEKLIRE
ncbi:MAG TPA: T9SS type A sorting domain-containing protein, partial [Bacteroidetes bacterium]|nr:T9SS type A sorting domain-containing protein [Bacteroidota bacterium]